MNRRPQALLVLLPLLCIAAFLLNARMRKSHETHPSETHAIEKSPPPASPNHIITADMMIHEYYPTQLATSTSRPSNGDVMACAWLLILKNYTSPKQTIIANEKPGPATQPAPEDTNAWRNVLPSAQPAAAPTPPPDLSQTLPTNGPHIREWWRDTRDSTWPLSPPSSKPRD